MLTSKDLSYFPLIDIAALYLTRSELSFPRSSLSLFSIKHRIFHVSLAQPFPLSDSQASNLTSVWMCVHVTPQGNKNSWNVKKKFL